MNSNTAPTLTLIVALPRAGKSTWAEQNKRDRELLVEPDWIRRNILGHDYCKASEPIIWLICDSFARIALGQGTSVLLDGVHLTKFVRQKYIRLAQDMGAHVDCIWIDTPLEICLERNHISEEEKKLPGEALINKADSFEPPTQEEGFRQVIVIGDE